MTIGTKSLLFGVHQILLHPLFVAAAWKRLYSFPWDPRLWVAFFLHDIGYFGCSDMDREEGARHPEWGAALMWRLFDRRWATSQRRVGNELRYGLPNPIAHLCDWIWGRKTIPPEKSYHWYWYTFTVTHSRHYAKRLGMSPSRLCVADKLSLALMPWWLYLSLANLTGEIDEYMRHAAMRVEVSETNMNQGEIHGLLSGDQRLWFSGLQSYFRRWAEAHHNNQDDDWTRLDTREKEAVSWK